MTEIPQTTPDARASQKKIDDGALAEASAVLREANVAFAKRYPGDGPARQPVHTVYGGAQLFVAETAAKLGALALRAFGEYVPTPATFGEVLGIPDHPALPVIHERVWGKLRREPVEDYRIDFEDGYGVRPNDEEDHHAGTVVAEVIRGMNAGVLPPFIGIRVKPLTEESRARSTRTLDLVLTGLVNGNGLPPDWLITVPKITIPEQVEFFAAALTSAEQALGLARGTLRFEIMIETPQVIIDRTGRSALPRLLDAADGRLAGAHFGAYDYTASCNIAAGHQRQRHPACEFAKNAMSVAFAGTPVRLSDGATALLPVPIHRTATGSAPLTEAQRAENAASMRVAWRVHFDDVRHSLDGGFYQSWDLHPAQLVSRYAAVFSFFLEGSRPAGERLRNFIASAAQATLAGNVFDDAATGQGLLNFFIRGINSGAFTEVEALAMTGLAGYELRGRSFATILEDRKKRAGISPGSLDVTLQWGPRR